MSTARLNPSQQRIVEDLREALSEFRMGSEKADRATLFDLLGTAGMARRLVLQVPDADASALLCQADEELRRRGDAPWDAFREVQPNELVDRLATALADKEPERIFDMMYDLDLTLSALETAGLQDSAIALRDDAVDVVRLFAECDEALQEIAARMSASVGTVGGAGPVWQALDQAAATTEDESLSTVPAPDWLDEVLASDPLRGVIRLLRVPTQASEPSESWGLAAAASMATMQTLFTVLDTDTGAGWELCQRHAGDKLHLVVAWFEGEPPRFTVVRETTGESLHVTRSGDRNQVYVECGPGESLAVTVAGRIYQMQS